MDKISFPVGLSSQLLIEHVCDSMTTPAMRLISIVCIFLMSVSVVSAMTGELKIITDPEGATVIHDGTVLGKTTLVIPDLPMGEYTFKIKKTGYEEVTKTVNIRTLSRTVRYTLDPKEVISTISPTPSGTPYLDSITDSGKVSVKIYSVPDGAAVFVNGADSRQVTPATISLIPGNYKIMLNLNGYDTYNEEIAFPEESPLKVNLVPSTRGSMRVMTVPDDSQIYLNGILKERDSDSLIKDLEFGQYTLEVKKPGYKTFKDTITFNSVINNFEITLEAVGGAVYVNSIPTGAHAAYNGKIVWNLTPLVMKLPPGDYTIAALSSDSAPKSKKITLGLGDEVWLNFVMDGPQGEANYNGDGTITVGINTDPEGASITIDDKKYDTVTPAFVTLRPGTHDVKLSLLKYQTYKEEIKFPDENPLNVKLIEAMTDYPDVSSNEILSDSELLKVTIYTGPSGAEIILMGESGTLTGTSPVSFEVTPGEYNLRATLPNYKNYQKVYTIDQDGMDITIQLESAYTLYGN